VSIISGIKTVKNRFESIRYIIVYPRSCKGVLGRFRQDRKRGDRKRIERQPVGKIFHESEGLSMSRKRHKVRLIGDGLGEYGRRLFREELAAVQAQIRQQEKSQETTTDRAAALLAAALIK
jgi:hypothetical protein